MIIRSLLSVIYKSIGKIGYSHNNICDHKVKYFVWSCKCDLTIFLTDLGYLNLLFCFVLEFFGCYWMDHQNCCFLLILFQVHGGNKRLWLCFEGSILYFTYCFSINECSCLKVWIGGFLWKYHYEKLCLSKSHYPTTKTQKNSSYTAVMQLSLGYYNIMCNYPLRKTMY